MPVPDERTVALIKGEATADAAGSAGQRPCLILYNGPDTGRPFALEPGPAVIGRSPDAQIHLDSPGLSRRHAELLVTSEQVTLRDLGSVNGSFVNDQPAQAATPLRDGDLVRLGDLLLKFHEQQSLEAALHDRIYRLATVDVGTQVFNRRYLFDTLRRELRLARLSGRPLALVSCDLDRFKSVNDTHGHAAGDLVLHESAAVVRAALQGSGILGRMGGEEFAIVLPHTDMAQAMHCAEQVRRAVAEHAFHLPGGVLHRQTLSLGVALFSEAMNDADELLAAADQRLYASKHGGRDRVTG